MILRLAGGDLLLDALSTAASAALSLFLAWIIGREIDPANEWSAFVALPAVYAVVFIFGPPAFMATFFAILFSRVINRTAGLKAKKSDAILLIIIGTVLFVNGFITALPLLTVILVCDTFLEPPNQKLKLFVFISPAIFLVMLFFFPSDALSFGELSFLTAAGSLLLVVSAALLSGTTKNDRVIDDLNRAELTTRRIILARVFVLLFILGETFFQGSQAFLAFYPAALCFFGAVLYQLSRLLRAKITGSI